MKMKNEDENKALFKEIKQDMLGNNFVIKVLWGELKKKTNKLKLKKQTAKDIEKLEKLQLITSLFYQLAYLGGKKLYKYKNDKVVVSGHPVKVEEEGVYVRYNPFITREQWLELYDEASLLVEKMKLFKNANPKDFKKKKERYQLGSDDIKLGLNLYFEIEKKLLKYWKKGKPNDILYAEEDGASMVDRALEEILVKKNLEDDKKLNELKKQHKEAYYRVCERYDIPTMRELPQYLKLLNEIAS